MRTVCPAARDLAKRDKTVIMNYYVYVLKSLKNNDIYIGSTSDLSNRFKLHNSGKVKSTKGYRPWKLLECEKFNNRSETFKREMFLKEHQQKDIIKKKYGLVAK